MSAQVHQSSVLSGRSVALLVSFAVPMLFLYGLARNIGLTDILSDPPMKVRFFDPPPVIPPDIVDEFKPVPAGNEDRKLDIPRPDIPFPEDEPVVGRVTETPPVTGGAAGSGTGTTVAPIPATPLRYTALRPSDDFYPPAAIRMAEQGSAQIKVCVSASGALQGMPTVIGSSGHARLDAAAVTWAREALRFEPATENGMAVASCKGFRVHFTLR